MEPTSHVRPDQTWLDCSWAELRLEGGEGGRQRTATGRVVVEKTGMVVVKKEVLKVGSEGEGEGRTKVGSAEDRWESR